MFDNVEAVFLEEGQRGRGIHKNGITEICIDIRGESDFHLG